MNKKELNFICPNGHLGFAPLKPDSFYLGVEEKPDYIVADSGSNDVGPMPLGTGTSVSPLAWQEHDLDHMLRASRKIGATMIIGSAGDTGANNRVDLYVDIIKKLAREHKLPKFNLGYFYSEVPQHYLIEKLQALEKIPGLDGRGDLSVDDVKRTDRIVAMAGVHPYIQLLEQGAEVIIGGRSSDCNVFAAPAIMHGFPEELAYHLGKVMECASFCAEPYGAKETILGTITHEDIKVKAMHPGQRCTIASVAGHAMYERSDPYFEYVAGGVLDMTNCKYEQYDEKTCRITGPVFKPSEGVIYVKLEGAGRVGERYIGIAGVRDPYNIQNIDRVIEWCREQVREKFGESGYQLRFHIYGKNGVMGDLEPIKEIRSHELCIVVEGIAPTKEMAEEITITGTRQIFYARLPEVKGTAGTAAFLVEEAMHASPSYEWTMNHIVPVKDPMELFEVHMTEAGI